MAMYSSKSSRDNMVLLSKCIGNIAMKLRQFAEEPDEAASNDRAKHEFIKGLRLLHSGWHGHTHAEVVGAQRAALFLLGRGSHLMSHDVVNVGVSSVLHHVQDDSVQTTIGRNGQSVPRHLDYIHRPTMCECLSMRLFHKRWKRCTKNTDASNHLLSAATVQSADGMHDCLRALQIGVGDVPLDPGNAHAMLESILQCDDAIAPASVREDTEGGDEDNSWLMVDVGVVDTPAKDETPVVVCAAASIPYEDSVMLTDSDCETKADARPAPPSSSSLAQRMLLGAEADVASDCDSSDGDDGWAAQGSGQYNLADPMFDHRTIGDDGSASRALLFQQMLGDGSRNSGTTYQGGGDLTSTADRQAMTDETCSTAISYAGTGDRRDETAVPGVGDNGSNDNAAGKAVPAAFGALWCRQRALAQAYRGIDFVELHDNEHGMPPRKHPNSSKKAVRLLPPSKERVAVLQHTRLPSLESTALNSSTLAGFTPQKREKIVADRQEYGRMASVMCMPFRFARDLRHAGEAWWSAWLRHRHNLHEQKTAGLCAECGRDRRHDHGPVLLARFRTHRAEQDLERELQRSARRTRTRTRKRKRTRTRTRTRKRSQQTMQTQRRSAASATSAAGESGAGAAGDGAGASQSAISAGAAATEWEHEQRSPPHMATETHVPEYLVTLPADVLPGERLRCRTERGIFDIEVPPGARPREVIKIQLGAAGSGAVASAALAVPAAGVGDGGADGSGNNSSNDASAAFGGFGGFGGWCWRRWNCWNTRAGHAPSTFASAQCP